MGKIKFMRLLREALGIDGEEFTEETNLRELEQFDSLGVLALISFVDESFHVQLGEAQVKSITTVRSLMDCIGEAHFE